MKKHNTVALFLAIALLLTGVGVLLYPSLHRVQQSAQSKQAVQDFLQLQKSAPLPAKQSEAQQFAEVPYADLRQAMRHHNEEIYANKQAGLSDPWAYTAEVFKLSDYGLQEETAAVLTIPKMDLQEPVYLGATQAHLDGGIAQLSISSMPIGGKNTNCVLAGHRGWNGALFFRHIELLELGDELYITNLWETLHYRVTDIRIIQPNQVEEILIQPGRDLLTLITCHPYGSGGAYRYVVCCERME